MERVKNQTIKKILKKYKLIKSLEQISAVFYWDIDTYMPKKSIKYRSLAIQEISKFYQKFFRSKSLIKLVEQAEKEELNDVEKGIIRVLRRSIDYYNKIPKKTISEFSKIKAKSRVAWEEAKLKNKPELFIPYLKKLVELSKEKAKFLGYEDKPYDALLDLYEEGLRTKYLDSVFSRINEIKKLYKKVKKDFHYNGELLKEEYDKEKLKEFLHRILDTLGFNNKVARLDKSEHPFTIGVNPFDVRITFNYYPEFREPILAVVHEFGHALYHLQSDKNLYFTPVYDMESMGVHESQSRFWENHIGKSYPFIKFIKEKGQRYLPFLKNYDVEEIYYYWNSVKVTPIRIHADEISYHLHIYLRFEIEKLLINEDLPVEEVPELWNQKMEELLSIKPKNYSEGFLQDIHWSLGAFGYFPTYSLGSFLAAQIWERIKKDVQINEINKSTTKRIREWLKEKIHKYGNVYEPKVLLKKVVNDYYNMDSFIKYVKEKYL